MIKKWDFYWDYIGLVSSCLAYKYDMFLGKLGRKGVFFPVVQEWPQTESSLAFEFKSSFELTLFESRWVALSFELKFFDSERVSTPLAVIIATTVGWVVDVTDGWVINCLRRLHKRPSSAADGLSCRWIG